jgi:transposase
LSVGFSTETIVHIFLTGKNMSKQMDGKANCVVGLGHSKEKRSDCPLVTLGLVLDSSGFVRHSRMFAGNVAEAATLETMFTGLNAPEGALVIMDRGIATETYITWLLEKQYKYLVVSREKSRQFDMELATPTTGASEQTIHVQKVVGDDGREARLYSYSEARQKKEDAMTACFCM